MHLYSLHYLPQINYIQSLLKADEICFEMQAHFQRQTFRNRCEIYTADGIHKLVVPIDHTGVKLGRSKMCDVKISYADNWQVQHQRTIQSAYQSSSYYEYFEAEFVKLFEKKHVFLADLNIASIEMIFGFLKTPLHYSKTTSFIKSYGDEIDEREKFTMNTNQSENKYYQVFRERKGFIGNLSSIDMLFNIGPKAMLTTLGV